MPEFQHQHSPSTYYNISSNSMSLRIPREDTRPRFRSSQPKHILLQGIEVMDYMIDLHHALGSSLTSRLALNFRTKLLLYDTCKMLNPVIALADILPYGGMKKLGTRKDLRNQAKCPLSIVYQCSRSAHTGQLQRQ